ncbi:MAG: riboflavin synthase [Polyangiaceae bacterium]|nr:riboflavin synthase [Polyangiaceae bacterium]MCW5790319.1 riboflavin synthase [Polyangiaceae bacterium]
MFTGLVEAVGCLKRRERRGPGFELWIEAPFTEYSLGESIAVAGACLTVTRFGQGGFAADVSQETAALTRLGALPLGARVNLERSLQVGARLGGHWVSGHVDGTAELSSQTRAGEAISHAFRAPPELMRFIAAKGSVTLDGVSLTVNRLLGPPAFEGQARGPAPTGPTGLSQEALPDGFEVMLIPHTLQVTTLGELVPGARVNLEVDLLARYAVRYLAGAWPRGDHEAASESDTAARDAHLRGVLASAGFKL